MANPFNVNDMIAASNSNEFDASSIFRKNPVSGKIAAEKQEISVQEPIIEAPIKKQKKQEDAWVPDSDVLAATPEVTKSSGVVYDKKDVVLKEDTELKNISDEIITKASEVEEDEMTRIAKNLREACFRNHIRELHIPEVCPERAMLVNIANGKDLKAVSESLDAVFAQILEDHPDWIIQKFDEPAKTEVTEVTEGNGEQTIINPGKPDEDGIKEPPRGYSADDVKIIIDKSQVDQLNFTDGELDKIRKSHTIELNIREKGTINFSDIEHAPEDSIDRILNTYKPQVNGIQIVLPASRYRCTVSGLSYPDLIEISTDREINDQDAARSIWSICFKHIHNPSIGAFESYTTYTDPTGEVHKVKDTDVVPEDAINIHHVSDYEDFLNKTSYLDQSYILWNILCQTASYSELVSARCLNEKCKNRLEFSYIPSEVLDVDSVSEVVQTEMEKTKNVSSEQEIMNWYNDSLVRSSSIVELPESKIKMQYGHASARVYVEELYNDMQEAEAMLDRLRNGEFSDRSLFGRLNTKLFLPAILSFIVPDPDDPKKLYKIDSTQGKIKVLDSLSFRDWAVIDEISTMIITPYRFRYILKGKRCPKCGTVNNFDLGGVEGLLFLIDDLRSGMTISLTT